MTAITHNIVKLHGSGTAGSVCLLTGEQIRQLLIYYNEDGDRVDLTGWTPSATAEWRRGLWTDDDQLEEHGIQGPVAPPLASEDMTARIEVDTDQVENPGVWYLYLPADLLPTALRDVEPNASDLPTLVCYITLSAPGLDAAKAQFRIAIGWRRGELSVE